MVEGVVLAAGLSSRAGVYKLTLELEGKTIIEKCILAMYELCSRVIVVGGYKIERLVPILTKYPKVELIYNPNYLEGMFSSVKTGFSQVREERFFFIPGDYPLISPKAYEDMLKINGQIIIPTYQNKKGHPVLLKKILLKELLEQSNYTNLRDFINNKEYLTLEVQEPGILLDMDTMEDYKLAQLMVNC